MQHFLDSLQPDIAAAIRENTNTSIRLIQESAEWGLQDRTTHAAMCVHDSLSIWSNRAAEVDQSRWSSEFRAWLVVLLALQQTLVGYH